MSRPIDLNFCERCGGPCIAGDPEPAKSVELSLRAKHLAAWPLVEKLLDECDSLAARGYRFYGVADAAKRLREALKP